MGKTIEKVKLWNIFNEEKIKSGEFKPLEVEEQVDNSVTAGVILPPR